MRKIQGRNQGILEMTTRRKRKDMKNEKKKFEK